MKRIFIAILFLSGILMSCKKFLEVEPKGKTILRDFAHYNGLLNNPYLGGFEYLKFTATSNAETGDIGYSFSILGSLEGPFYMSDDVVANTNVFGNLTLIQKNQYRWASDIYLPDDNSAEWGTMYSLNYVYNLVINGIMDANGGTPMQKKQLLAEARVARAHMHFWTAQLFAPPYREASASTEAGIPLIKEASTEISSIDRATLKGTYDFIITEINEALPDLDDVTYNRNRISKTAAYYLLGETYFYMQQYDKALAAFQKAEQFLHQSKISIGLYDYNTKVNVWYVPFMSNLGLVNHPNPYDSEESIYTKQSSAAVSSAFAGRIVLRPEVYALFGDNDHRRKIFSNRGLFSSSLVLPGYQRSGPLTVNYGSSLPNLILMKAECEARQGALADAEKDLLSLRKKRMPEADAAVTYDGQEGLVKKILEERIREFAATGLRWLDMRRLFDDVSYNNLVLERRIEGQTYTLTKERLCLRIPPNILQYNPNMQDNK